VIVMSIRRRSRTAAEPELEPVVEPEVEAEAA
jgi:hypothetical protein